MSIADHVSAAVQKNLFELSTIDPDASLVQSLVTIGSSIKLPSIVNSSYDVLTPNIAIEVNRFIA